MRNLGMRNIKIVQKLPKDQQIDAGRMLLARCWFDEEGAPKGCGRCGDTSLPGMRSASASA